MMQSTKNHKSLEPPQSIPAEQAVLGSILKDPNALLDVAPILNSHLHFYVPKHRIIFEAIMNLFEKNEPCDATMVAEELQRTSNLEKVGNRSYLIELIDGVASTANVTSYANIVLDKSMLRRLISSANDIVGACYEEEDEPDAILSAATEKIFAAGEKRIRKNFVNLSGRLADVFTSLNDLQQNPNTLMGLSTGYRDIDDILGGMKGGDYIVIAGRPSMGKTSLAMNIAENLAMNDDKTVGIFSLEQQTKELAMRFLCGRARVNSKRASWGKMTTEDWDRLARASAALQGKRLFIDDSPTLSTLEMRTKGRQFRMRHNADLIVIDYMQLLNYHGRTENRQQEMSNISRHIKAMAKELDIPIIAVSQLSRLLEQRSDKRPQLSDLRESGAIEQDADIIMFVYREEYYLSNLPELDKKRVAAEGKAEIIVAKHRNGPIGRAHLAFIKEYSRFEALYSRESQENMAF